MRSSAPRPIRIVRPRRQQAQRRYPLRDLKPIALDAYRFDWFREAAKLLASMAFVVAAILLWTVKPWL